MCVLYAVTVRIKTKSSQCVYIIFGFWCLAPRSRLYEINYYPWNQAKIPNLDIFIRKISHKKGMRWVL